MGGEELVGGGGEGATVGRLWGGGERGQGRGGRTEDMGTEQKGSNLSIISRITCPVCGTNFNLY